MSEYAAGERRNDFKDEFYRGYYTTHVLGRKGQATLDQFGRRSAVYDRTWASLLPSDRGARILDIGCGTGSLVWWMQRRGYAGAGGIDVSREQVEAAQALGVANVAQAHARPFLESAPDWYDRLILRDVIEHFERTEIVELLRACLEALKPGGRIIVQVPNAEAPLWGRIRYGDFTHEMAFTESSLRQLLAVVGFETPEFFPAGPVLAGLRALPRRVLWKTAEALYKILAYAETGRRRVVVTEAIIVAAARPPSASGGGETRRRRRDLARP